MSMDQFIDSNGEVTQQAIEARAEATSRSTWVSIAANVALTAGQMIVGTLAKSQALVSDGIHSLSDVVADVVVLVAGHQGRKDADDDHPYGHQRFETAAMLMLGGLLLLVGLGMFWSAAMRMQNPSAIPHVSRIALWAACAALLVKETLFRYMMGVAKRVKSSMLAANAWHARSDAASSLVVALGILGNLLGVPILDPIAAIIVGFMVARMGWSFGWQAMNDLMDHAADDEEVASIRATLLGTPGVAGVHDLRTRKAGDMIMVDAHIEVDPHITVEAAHAITVEAQRRTLIRHRVLSLMTHIDPWEKADLDHQLEVPRTAGVTTLVPAKQEGG